MKTCDLQEDKEARRADAKALAVEGKLVGSITTPLYSSFHAFSNSTGAILGVTMSWDQT